MNRHFPALLPALALASLTLLAGCRKEDDPEPSPAPPSTPASLTLQVEHHIDGAPLQFGSAMQYATPMGLPYSVSRAEHYLSEIVLHGTNGTPNDTLHGPFYMNGDATFNAGRVPAGSYDGATLLLGLPPGLNVTGGLPSTIENVNMAWPDPMGGGYHFIKFEGHFEGAGGAPTGFAMHIGGNPSLPQAAMGGAFTHDGDGGKLILRFDLNELFRTPHLYDLAAGNYSMGDMMLMGQLRDNAADAFTLTYQP